MNRYKVGIIGITGRMGTEILKAIKTSDHLICIGGINKSKIASEEIKIFDLIDELAELSDVLIDFSNAGSTVSTCLSAQKSGKPIVIGTTGFSETQYEQIIQASCHIPVLIASNFSIGINLMSEAANQIAKILFSKNYDIEISEKHHKHKKDAPSGTALALGKSLATSIGETSDALQINNYSGTRPDGKIGISFARGGSVFGEHTISFLGENEILEVTHKALNRKSFAEGAICAASWIIGRPAGMYSMSDIITT